MSNILQELESEIAALKTSVSKSNVGIVREIGDGVAKVEGLSDVMLNEMIEFPGGLYGLALNLEETEVGCILLGDGLHVKEGDEVQEGQPLCTVEAMKMENVLRAERKAVVKRINAAPGDSLAVDAVIMEFE